MCRFGGRIRPRYPIHPPTPQKPVKEDPLPLKSVEVEATIKDFTAEITIRQKFKNEEENPIEAVYQFPMDEKNCICGFTAIVDGRVIKGECQEKEQAKDTYDDAIAEGHGAYLLEKSKDIDNVFTVNIGNLPPGKEADVAITFVTELQFQEGQLQWILPNDSPKNSSRASNQNLPSLALKVELDMTSNIRSLASPSHPIAFEFGEEPTKATVTLGDAAQSVDKDFVLNVKLAQPHQPCGRVQQSAAGDLAAMVALYPKIELGEDEEIYTEMVFIVDRSGSMAGSRINQVKDSLQIFLRSLGEGTMFNIVGFGTRTELLFKDGSVEYNDKNLDIATKHVQDLRANLGGTNILRPLQQILSSKPKEGYPRQIFILTDGEVTNTQECIKFVRQHADTTRVFTFGVGNEASQELVKGLAKAGEGFFEFIGSGQSMEDKVMRQLNRAMQPAFTDLSVDWGVFQAQQAPFHLPPLFVGSRLVVYGFLPAGSPAEGDVTLRAQTAIKPFETTVHLKIENAERGDLFHKSAARRLIQDLEENRSYLHASGRSSDGAIKDEMVRLSTTYGVLCKHTAFVAVEERDEATEGSMQVRKFGISLEKPHDDNKPVPMLHNNNNLQRLGMIIPPPAGRSSSARSSWASGGPRGGAMPAKPMALRSRAPVAKDKQMMKKGGKVNTAERVGGGGGGMLAKMGMRRKSSKSEAKKMDMAVRSSSLGGAPPPPPPSSSAEECRAAPCAPPPVPSSSSASLSSAILSSRLVEREASAPAEDFLASSADDSWEDNDDASEEEEEKEESTAPPPASMRAIIMKQKATGCWSPDDVASLLAPLSIAAIKKAVPSGIDRPTDDDVIALWITAVTAAYLQVKFPGQSTNWNLVVQKARKWIAKQKKALNVQVDVLEEAKKFVQAN